MVPDDGQQAERVAGGDAPLRRGLHADGHHGGERREEVRRLARRAGRVRAQEPAEGRGGAVKAGVFDEGDRPRQGDALRERASASRSSSSATSWSAATRRSRASRRSSRRSRRTGASPPGNASPLSDGAAAALVMSKAKADSLGVDAARLLPRVRDRRRRSGASWASARSRPCASSSQKTGLSLARHRRHRAQRGLREPGRLRPAHARDPRREAQRPRRRDRARPSRSGAPARS